MKTRAFPAATTLAILALLLAGCSRTANDIAKWKAKGNVQKLVGALADPKPEIRVAAAEALGGLKAEAAVDALASLYNDPEPEVVLAAVHALAAVGTPSTTTPLIAGLTLPDPAARTAAAEGLGRLRALPARDALAEALGDEAEAVACAAAAALGMLGDEQASAALAAKLSAASSAKLRLACAEALGSTGGEAAARGLAGALDDGDDGVRKAAAASLVAIGRPALPFVLETLRSESETARRGAIGVLETMEAVPAGGSDALWYALARASIGGRPEIDGSVVAWLAASGVQAVPTLVEAAAHPVAGFREHAFRALEAIGEPCAGTVAQAAGGRAVPAAAAWFNGRAAWQGAPSWRLDLWGAATALNPAFRFDKATADGLQAQGRPAFRTIAAPGFEPAREYIPLLVALLGDQTEPPPEQPDFDASGIPIVKQEVDRFRGEANQLMAAQKLAAAGDLAVFPLIAAACGADALVAGHAAAILGETGDKRAVAPLAKVLRQKIAAGEALSQSPFYHALQRLDDPEAEPVLLKVRPNADRAMRVFERQYDGVRAMSAESRDAAGIDSRPITFRLGYLDDGRMGELEITFHRDHLGDWRPIPPLPARLP